MAHEGLWEQVEDLRPEETAKRANCRYVSAKGQYTISFLNKEYVVDVGRRRIFSEDSEGGREKAGFLEQLCLLVYLINARDLPIAEELLSAEKLPGGQFFFRGPHQLPVDKLVETFGRRPEDIYQVMERLGARRCEFGGASIELYVLPRVPLTIVVWGGCEEFDARASILFDQTASVQLPLDALLTAVSLAVDAVVKSGVKNNT